MIPKDYYKILDVKPSARASEIKKNYRRLAMKYHPDKNEGDSLAAEVFGELAEAYNILSDPQKRKAYNDSRYDLYPSETYIQPEITKEGLLADINSLQIKVAALDPFRLNKDALYYSILKILPGEAIDFLQQNQDAGYKLIIIDKVLQCSKLLALPEIIKITGELSSVATDNEQAQQLIKTFLAEAARKVRWGRYQVWLVVLLAIVLVLLIFFIGK